MKFKLCPISWLVGAACGIAGYVVVTEIMLSYLLIAMRDLP